MAHAALLDIVDAGLRTITGTNVPFGGKVVLLGGDFRQVLPVVTRGTRGNQVAAAIWNASAWRHFQTYHLNCNMHTDADQIDFARWLLDIGDGTLGDTVQVPEDCVVNGDLVDDIYGDIIDPNDVEYLRSRVILAPTNEACIAINSTANAKLPGDVYVYRSIDSATEDAENAAIYPVEFINTLTPSGMPPHILSLKVGSVVMLLRNLNINKGLCNGVRMIVKNIHPHTIHCELITGLHAGSQAFIPRTKLIPVQSQSPFQFIRMQFPVQMAFAMTINKAQGQTISHLGVHLIDPVFSHGQLYVAFSRVRSRQSLRVKLTSQTNFVRNVVYQEVIQHQRTMLNPDVNNIRVTAGNHDIILQHHIQPQHMQNEHDGDPIGMINLDNDVDDNDHNPNLL